MRQLTAGLAIMAIAVTGCAATAAASTGTTSTAVTGHGATTATSGPASPAADPGGLARGGGLAQWVVDGTFYTKNSPARPLSGVVTFRDKTTGHTSKVTVGASGKFSLGLAAGTYTATGQAGHSDSPCSGQVTVTVRAGQLTRVALACEAT